MRTLLLVGALFALTACNESNAKSETPATSTESAAPTAGKKEAKKEAAKGPDKAALTDPSKATAKAPAKYTVKLETTKGDILIDVTREWSPNGADRFYNLVKVGYYDDVAFFRVIAGFMGQVGIHGDGKVNAAWRGAPIQDDPNKAGIGNKEGFVTFAKTGAPNSRTTQFFINLNDNSNLDRMNFTPFGKVRDMTVMKKIYSGYGEGAPRGRGPSQGRIQAEGNTYLRAEFPELDYIKRATIVEG